MATPRPTPPKQEEAHLLIEPPYGAYLVLPASMASEVLPKLRAVSREYANNGYTYTISTADVEIKMLSSEAMIAAAVTAKLKEE